MKIALVYFKPLLSRNPQKQLLMCCCVFHWLTRLFLGKFKLLNIQGLNS